MGELEWLEYLHITMCDVIKHLPSLSKLRNLLRLKLEHCAKLRAVEVLKELEKFGECGDQILHVLGKVARCTGIYQVGDKLDAPGRTCRTRPSASKAIATFVGLARKSWLGVKAKKELAARIQSLEALHVE